MNAAHKEANKQRRIRSFKRRFTQANNYLAALRGLKEPNQSMIDSAQLEANFWQNRLRLRGVNV